MVLGACIGRRSFGVGKKGLRVLLEGRMFQASYDQKILVHFPLAAYDKCFR